MGGCSGLLAADHLIFWFDFQYAFPFTSEDIQVTNKVEREQPFSKIGQNCIYCEIK